MADIQKASDTGYKDRNFDSVEKLLQVARSANEVQDNIDKYINNLELEDVKEETKVIQQQEQEQQIENRILPNYADYAVDDNIPHDLYENFTNKCPAAFSVSGTKIEVRQWKDVLLLTCEVLAKKDAQKFLSFAVDPTMRGRKVRYFSVKTDGMRKPVKLQDIDIY